jgi:hypothetical protein
MKDNARPGERVIGGDVVGMLRDAAMYKRANSHSAGWGDAPS